MVVSAVLCVISHAERSHAIEQRPLSQTATASDR